MNRIRSIWKKIRNTRLFRLLWWIINQRVFQFAAIGGSVVFLGAALLYGFVKIGINKDYANLLQAVIALNTNFVLNFFITWRDRDEPFWRSWLKFQFVKIFTVALNQALFIFFTDVVGLHYLVTYFLNVAIGSILNFTLNHYFVFEDWSWSELSSRLAIWKRWRF